MYSARPLTPEELAAHPEYPHVFWHLEPTKKGVLKVAETRGGPVDISWEIHGTGPTKIVVSPSAPLFLPFFHSY